MVLLDDRILELLSQKQGEYMAPSEMAEDDRIRHSSAHIGRRCKKLEEHGLLQSVGRGNYTITEQGIAYLKGEYNTSEGVNGEVGNEAGSGEERDMA